MTNARPKLAIAGLAGSFAIWALGFTALYAALSVGCALGWQDATLAGASALRLALIVIWLAHLAVLIWLFAVLRRRPAAGTTDRFLHRAGLATTAAAILATLWLGLTLHAAQMC